MLGGALVGRRDELDMLEALRGSAEAAGAVLVGDAGVGKTRLARAFIRGAVAGGADTAWVVGTHAVGGPALDTQVILRWDGLQIGVEVWDVDLATQICTGSWGQPTARRFWIHVPNNGCVTSAGTVRLYAQYNWDHAPFGNRDSFDAAPSSGFTPYICDPGCGGPG